ncbi:Protein-S-isoprenylcysteine O-methyltransferase Ste14 [Trichlorobacter thiogenes]|uniref:Protein-S-isoprenylcysteine O-methyltransferase Ste14 n=1 Tax=Trichlorobacter thiogenes TaxID=115783 RepID=A0A1T4RDL8_9BACT|nr:NnrU family protein [Trichlorobacter thiogenes]SKA14122.1 Protein-S-isoprenylcysteine O-methyltransferase Ste14 [Trichlorobacter thiogenes]
MPDSLDFILRLTVFCIIHSLLAAPRIKSRIQLFIGRPLPGYRLIYNLLSMLLFGWVMLAWQSTSVLYVPPGIWSLVLHGLQFIILWISLVCLRQTGLADFLGTNLALEDERPNLITTGCYAVVRHPLYLLGSLFLLLNPVITTRWIALTLFSIPYFIFGALLEERRMIRLFGETYRQYQRDVPFLIPRLNRQISAD